jgi:hypothetical protein
MEIEEEERLVKEIYEEVNDLFQDEHEKMA